MNPFGFVLVQFPRVSWDSMTWMERETPYRRGISETLELHAFRYSPEEETVTRDSPKSIVVPGGVGHLGGLRKFSRRGQGCCPARRVVQDLLIPPSLRFREVDSLRLVGRRRRTRILSSLNSRFSR